MATKKGAGSKKRTASKKGTVSKTRKKKEILNDPPIVISGGGGVTPTKVGRHRIKINYRGTLGSSHSPEAQNNGNPIIGVTVEVVGKTGGTTSRPQTIVFNAPWDTYQVTVTYNT